MSDDQRYMPVLDVCFAVVFLTTYPITTVLLKGSKD